MDELLTTLALGVIEMLLWLCCALALSVVWCLVMTLAIGGRFGLGVVRVGRRALLRRAAQRELANIAVEYQSAVSDIRAISAATRRQLRELSRIERE
jgi:hypothetical protein